MATQNTMKAAVWKKPGEPIVIEEVPIPEPTGRLMRVRVKAASLCHSDLHFISGNLGLNIYPQIIGHEAVSVIDKLGPEASSYGFQEGDLIGASLWHDMCLACTNCTTIKPEFCNKKKMKGFSDPGYFAEYTLADPESAVVVARAGNLDSVSPRLMAPLFCAGVTVWDAVDRARLRPGETVAIIGVGGLGSLAVRYAHALGAHVIALDVHDEQLKACKDESGVDDILNTRGLSPAELHAQVTLHNGGNPVDVAIVTSGSVPAYETAFGILRPEGRIIAVGVPGAPIPVSAGRLATQAISIIGATVPDRHSMKKCMDFSLRNNIIPRVNPRVFRLEDINEMIALMEDGKVGDGRMVVEFS